MLSIGGLDRYISCKNQGENFLSTMSLILCECDNIFKYLLLDNLFRICSILYFILLISRRMKWKKENKTKLDGGDGLDESPDSS
jgi:hypothetical protein